MTDRRSIFGWNQMDAGYYYAEAAHCRRLATWADAETSQILLDLARNYEARADAMALVFSSREDE